MARKHLTFTLSVAAFFLHQQATANCDEMTDQLATAVVPISTRFVHPFVGMFEIQTLSDGSIRQRKVSETTRQPLEIWTEIKGPGVTVERRDFDDGILFTTETQRLSDGTVRKRSVSPGHQPLTGWKIIEAPMEPPAGVEIRRKEFTDGFLSSTETQYLTDGTIRRRKVSPDHHPVSGWTLVEGPAAPPVGVKIERQTFDDGILNSTETQYLSDGSVRKRTVSRAHQPISGWRIVNGPEILPGSVTVVKKEIEDYFATSVERQVLSDGTVREREVHPLTKRPLTEWRIINRNDER